MDVSLDIPVLIKKCLLIKVQDRITFHVGIIYFSLYPNSYHTNNQQHIDRLRYTIGYLTKRVKGGFRNMAG